MRAFKVFCRNPHCVRVLQHQQSFAFLSRKDAVIELESQMPFRELLNASYASAQMHLSQDPFLLITYFFSLINYQ